MLLLLIRPIYCLYKFITTGENYCGERQARSLMAAATAVSSGFRALFKKWFMSSTSSAVGTGTVLGLHSALSPKESAFKGSDMREAHLDESKNLVKVTMDSTTSYFTIVVGAILVLLLVGTIAICCCGWSPSKTARRQREERWKEEMQTMMMQSKNKGDVELGHEMEGWIDVKKPGPKLAEDN